MIGIWKQKHGLLWCESTVLLSCRPPHYSRQILIRLQEKFTFWRLEFFANTRLIHFTLMNKRLHMRFYAPLFFLFSSPPPDMLSWGMRGDGELLPICEIKWKGVCLSKCSWQAHQSELMSNRFGRLESLFQMVFIWGPNRKRAVGRATQSWSRPQSDSHCSSALWFDSGLSCGTAPVFLPRLAHACHVWQPSEALFSGRSPQVLGSS